MYDYIYIHIWGRYLQFRYWPLISCSIDVFQICRIYSNLKSKLSLSKMLSFLDTCMTNGNVRSPAQQVTSSPVVPGKADGSERCQHDFH